MFRSIGNSVDKKKKILIKVNESDLNISRLFAIFLDVSFGKNRELIKASIRYNPSNKRIFIKTENKVIANELSLKAKELSRFLSREKIPVTQIVIE